MDEQPFAVMWPSEAASGGGAVASDLPVSPAQGLSLHAARANNLEKVCR